MSFFRARRARPRVVLDEEGAALITELKDERADTAALADLRLSSEKLSKALDALQPQYRDALILRFFEERSYAEMSDILQVPMGTVSTLLYRAKHALRDALPNTFTP